MHSVACTSGPFLTSQPLFAICLLGHGAMSYILRTLQQSLKSSLPQPFLIPKSV
jgi:hypothetical protein